jgi:hypothetical protein
MATLRKAVQIINPDSNVSPTVIANEITSTNPIDNFIGYLMNDGIGSDNGVYCQFNVPKNYVGTPKIVVKGLLDGGPGASDVLGFGVTGLPVANNESEDQAFGSEDLASATIGSGGLGYSDEDMLAMSITLSNIGTLVVDDLVFIYVFLDVSVTDYAGNFILQSIEFEYADA